MAGSDVEAPAPASLEVVKKANSMDVVASLRNVNDMKVSLPLLAHLILCVCVFFFPF